MIRVLPVVEHMCYEYVLGSTSISKGHTKLASAKKVYFSTTTF
jgi:hypothetical protein